MCRMVGVAFRGRFPVEALHDLQAVARDGRIPGEDQPGHRDGWGIVSYSNGWPRYMGRSSRPLPDDPSFESAVQDVVRLPPPSFLIAHARAASTGGATIQNAHPFVVGRTALAHNGTVYGLKPPYGKVPKGESDSEVLALILENRLEQGQDLVSALTSVIREDIAGHDFSAAVLIVSDGERLLAYRDFKDPARASYYDLKLARLPDSVVLFQETRCGYDGEISQVAKGELVSIDLDLGVDRRRMI